MALKIIVTPAGRAALVNAANTGTLPVLVSAVGVTATAFDPAGATVLPGELKRLVTFGGAAVADDTIHTTIRDDSADTYSLRGFGLYLADGTLFAVYGQAAVILEKSAQAMLLLATDIIFADIDAASLTFGDASFLNPPATTEVQGVVELATDAEAVTGTDAVRALTPKGLLAVLTARFGAGNPSAFVKSLLDKVSALAFVTALGIRGAASFDTGPGNGLDADLLDGQHGAYYLDYTKLQSVPLTFAPSAHQHSAADITGGVFPVARGGTGAATFAAGSYLIGAGTAAFAVKTPAQVLTDIGAAAVAHSHAISEVNGLQIALDARPVQTSVTAQITAAVNGLINGSPGALDTLNELAAAMGNDANFAATVTNALALKAPLNAPRFTGRTYVSTYVQSVFPALALSAEGGPIYLRPNGPDNAAGQAMLGTNGDLSVLGAVGAKSAVLTGDTGAFVNLMATAPGAHNWQCGQTAQASGGIPANAFYLYDLSKNMVRMSIEGESGAAAFAGSGSFAGGVSCLAMNASGSDIRLKTDVTPVAPRPLHRLLAALPDTHGALSSYVHRADHAHRLGPIAQDIERVEPAYMGTIEIAEGQVEGVAAGTYKTVDKASAAYEQAMWAGQEIDRLRELVERMERHINLPPTGCGPY